MNEATLTVLFVATFVVGVSCSAWLWRLYSRIAPTLLGRERLVLQALVVISWAITLTAGWFGFLSLRRVVGLPPLDWSSVVSLAIAEAVLLIPVYIVAVVRSVGVEDPDR